MQAGENFATQFPIISYNLSTIFLWLKAQFRTIWTYFCTIFVIWAIFCRFFLDSLGQGNFFVSEHNFPGPKLLPPLAALLYQIYLLWSISKNIDVLVVFGAIFCAFLEILVFWHKFWNICAATPCFDLIQLPLTCMNALVTRKFLVESTTIDHIF